MSMVYTHNNTVYCSKDNTSIRIPWYIRLAEKYNTALLDIWLDTYCLQDIRPDTGNDCAGRIPEMTVPDTKYDCRI